MSEEQVCLSEKVFYNPSLVLVCESKLHAQHMPAQTQKEIDLAGLYISHHMKLAMIKSKPYVQNFIYKFFFTRFKEHFVLFLLLRVSWQGRCSEDWPCRETLSSKHTRVSLNLVESSPIGLSTISLGGLQHCKTILVIFGRRALIFFVFVWKLLEKYENDTTFVHMRSGDHLGDAKVSKKSTSLRRI